MKVFKFGGASLKGARSLEKIVSIIQKEYSKRRNIAIVVSAFHNTTSILEEFLLTRLYFCEAKVKEVVEKLKSVYLSILKHQNVISQEDYIKLYEILKNKFNELERLLYGISYTKELTPRMHDLILSYGERISAYIVATYLSAKGISAKALESEQIGIITDDDFGNATVLLSKTRTNLKKRLKTLLGQKIIPVITGYFGCTEEGYTTTLGRGGSDYTAAVVAYALDAKLVEVWKDVDGFMSADPKLVRNAHLINFLSYNEAAELSYFGAKILHPRTVEPLILKKIPLRICNTFYPNNKSTLITEQYCKRKGEVKGVAYAQDIGVLKIFGAGVGFKPGVLFNIVSHITSHRINIKSVITSQTCISFLLTKEDLEKSYHILSKEDMPIIERLEKLDEVVLIGIVGDNIGKTKGLAARAFTALAQNNINIELTAGGVTSSAFYVIVKNKFLEKAVNAIHNEFFK